MDLDFDQDDYSGAKKSDKNNASRLDSSLGGKLTWADKLKKYVATK